MAPVYNGGNVRDDRSFSFYTTQSLFERDAQIHTLW